MRLSALVIVALAGVAHADIYDDALAPLDVEKTHDRPIRIVEIAPSWLSLHDTHPDAIRNDLAIALRHHGFMAATSPQQEISGELQVELSSRWGKPHVHIALQMKSGTATELDLDPPNDGLLTLSYARVGAFAGIVLVPLILLALSSRLFRGRKRVVPLENYRVPNVIHRAPKRDEAIAISAMPSDSMPVVAKPAIAATVLQAPKHHSIGLLGSISTPARIQDRYRVIAELGQGAMGVVYRAHDEKLEREVAVKVMSEAMRAHPEAMKMFASEGKALALLNHPNIVAIYDQVDTSSEAMLVMELVDGTTLDVELGKRGAYPWREALRIIDRALAGLAYAHGKNVLHRDIKPSNIFVTKDGDVKLGDFGLARVLREISVAATELRGTPMYMAPEQITGAPLDLRADLYSIGCTLFELIADRRLFPEGEPMYQHVNAEPQHVKELVGEIPDELDALVASLLAKSAADRPQTAQAVRAAIAKLLGNQSSPQPL